VGLTRAVGYEQPVFFTPAQAQRLSPRVHAVVAEGAPDRVRSVVGTEAQVLTGNGRHLVDDSRAQDLEDIDNTVTLLPIMAGVAGTTAIFVIASTFALTVIQRRREIALLRAVGATGKQVRRMVIGEAAVIGAAASLVGCLLGLFGANVLAGWLGDLGVSPAWFGVHRPYGLQVWLPLLGSFLIGVLVAVLAVVVAARRAGRVGPTEALREAAADDTAGPGAHWWLGLAALLTALAVTGRTAFVAPSTALSPNTYVLLLLVPVVAFALLTPISVGPLTRVLMRPLTRSRRAGPMLVRESALTARRRTAATAAPVLLTVGIAGSLLGATGSVSAARDDGVRNLVSADYVIVPAGAPGISPAVVDRIRAKVPGVEVVAPVRSTVYTQDDGRIEENDAQIVHGAALSTAFRLPMVSGSSAGLDADSVVLPQAWGHAQGETVPMMLGDGRSVRLRVTGVYRALQGQDIAYLSSEYLSSASFAADGMARRAYVTLRPGTDPAAASAALRTEAARAGLAVAATDRFQVSEAAAAQHLISVRQRSVAVIVLLFCFIAVLNTLLMSTADRRRDLAVLRMAGATPRQVLAVFAGESLLVGVIGVVLGLAAAALNLIGLQFALRDLFGSTSVQVPWLTVLGVALLGVALAVLGAVLPAVVTGRGSTAELAGLRE
jgi:putative ABC transport system permease protein